MLFLEEGSDEIKSEQGSWNPHESKKSARKNSRAPDCCLSKSRFRKAHLNAGQRTIKQTISTHIGVNLFETFKAIGAESIIILHVYCETDFV